MCVHFHKVFVPTFQLHSVFFVNLENDVCHLKCEKANKIY